MKVKLIVLSFMLSFLCELNAQNDAFFYENYEQRFEDDLMGFDFGNFSTQEFGFNFGGFSDEESGFDFGDFSKDENGFNFGDFDFEDVDAPLGNGLLLLTATSLLYLKRNKKIK